MMNMTVNNVMENSLYLLEQGVIRSRRGILLRNEERRHPEDTGSGSGPLQFISTATQRGGYLPSRVGHTRPLLFIACFSNSSSSGQAEPRKRKHSEPSISCQRWERRPLLPSNQIAVVDESFCFRTANESQAAVSSGRRVWYERPSTAQ